jgi:hypothetical protein
MSSNLPYHVYYDLSFINNNTTGTNDPVVLTLSDTRTNPYIEDPSDYFVSVARFQIATSALPVFIPQVQLGQADPNKLVYAVTLTWSNSLNTNHYKITTNIIYVCSDSSISTPNPPTSLQDLTSTYYYVYTYQQWLKMINTALLTCYNNLSAAVTTGGDAAAFPQFAPFFEYDPNLCVFILNANQLGYDQIVLTNPIKLYFNSSLFTLFNNFQNLTLTSADAIKYNLPLNYWWNIMIYSMNGTNILQSGANNFIQMYQEGSTIALLNPVESVVLTSGIIPINNENVGIPRLFNASKQLVGQTQNNANISPIISDFQIEMSPTNQYKPQISYVPNGEYRLIDLYGSSSLSNIQIGVLWKDIFGYFRQFILQPGMQANVKLLFRRKDYYSQKLNN